MLGIIVEAKSDMGQSKIFHKFGLKTALERILASCLLCPFAHKVILAMPSADKTTINGSVFQSRLIGAVDRKDFLGRKLDYFFHGRPADAEDRAYRAALTHQLSDVVLVSAENALIPTWLLSAAISEYHRKCQPNKVLSVGINFPKGFGFQVVPFHLIAEKHTAIGKQNDPPEILELKNDGVARLVANDGADFVLDGQEKISVFSRIFEELDAGADLSDLMEDFVE